MKTTRLLMTAAEMERDPGTWLTLRKRYITGTDAGTIMGVNPWKTPLMLYHEKLGDIPAPEVGDSDAVHFGKVLENVVAQEFTRQTGIKVARRGIMASLYDPNRAASIDRICLNTDFPAGLECKTTSAFKAEDWADGKIPPHYYYQCLHYMSVMYGDAVGNPVVDGAGWYIACLIGGNRFIYRHIPYDTQAIKALVKAEDAFYNRLIHHEPPPVTDSANDEKLLAALNQGTAPAKPLDCGMEELIARMDDIKLQIEQYKKLLQADRNELIAFLDQSDTAVGHAYRVSYKMRKGREVVDMAALRKNPQLYQALRDAELLKETAGSRTLIIKETKNG